jgi:endonuclease/exonuclease/phosphatase family metal-dependent hydrolase
MPKRRLAPKIACLLPLLASAAMAQQIRVATYNIEDDIDGATTPLPGMNTVLQGIGEDNVDGISRPLDILGLEETTSNSLSVAPIVADLNGDYPGAAYAMSTYQATEEGGDNADGNGPNAVVYNTKTLQLLASVGVGTPEGSGNGEYRQVVRYEFEPAGGTASQEFYVYVCHAKASSGSTNAFYRAEEATIIRNDAASLPAGSSVIYMGDWNTDASTDQSVINLTASGAGQAFDTLNPANLSENWATNSAYQGIMTESATDLRYRDDIQFVTQNVLSGSGALGYITASANALGNDGRTPVFGTVNSGSNTAGAGFTNPTQSAVLSALTTASDHLPVVADYNIISDADATMWANTGGGSWNASGDWTSGVIPQLQGQSADFGASILAPSTVTLDGNWTIGHLNFNNPNAYTIAPGTGGKITLDNGGSAATITDSAGSDVVNVPLVFHSSLVVIVSSGQTLSLDGGISGGGLTVAGGGTLVLGNAPNSVSALTLNSGAALDLGSGAMSINYAGASPLPAIQGCLASASLFSSAAAASDGKFALGYADGSLDTATSAQPNQVLIQYALVGDTNLDGGVNITDLLKLLDNYGQTGADWSQGDFNYDGTVNITDLLAMLNNYDQSTSQSTIAVPEPAAGLLALGTALIIPRRRRLHETSRV